jgi:hypothetical protein
MKVLPSRMQFADGGRVHQHFERHHAAIAVDLRHELLGKDAAQGFGHHDADLIALIDGEHVEHAVECARGAAGVKGAEHQVARFSRGDGERDRLQVAHFTDHDHVRVFTQSTAESGGEGLRVVCDLALVHMAALRLDDVLDRVFQRDDVILTLGIDGIHEGGERGGFAAADGAGDEDEAVVEAVSVCTVSGRPSSSIVLTFVLMTRKTMSMPRRCCTTEARKRP